jgi:thiol-disulfide isomerase/thioredoxin
MSCSLRAAGVVLAVSWVAFLRVGAAADPFRGADPAWNLIHEPAVERELRLSPAQQREFRGLLGELDAGLFPLRNRPAAEADAGARNTLATLERQLERLLSAAQMRRWAEIQVRRQGTAALLRPGVAGARHYTPRQREQLEQVIADTLQATQELERRAADGEDRRPLEQRYAALQKAEWDAVSGILSAGQQSLWRKACGRDFDLTALGHARFKPPELVDSGTWLNSDPLTLESLAGKVVVLHFYACGCINCIRNQPTYAAWQERYRDQDVVILGIHTPETAAEQDPAHVRKQAAAAGLGFPVLIDGAQANWNAWGNSMWPSVYLIDKQGYLRHFWPGELKWQGATGDRWMQDRIDALLAEPAAP